MRYASIAAAALLLLASCGDVTEPAAAPKAAPEQPSMNQVNYVNLCCNTTLYVGGTTQFAVTVYPFVGNPYTTQNAIWGSSNSAVASVGAFGLVQAHSPGATAISATVDGKSASIVVQVIAAPVVTTVQILNGPLGVQIGHPRSVSVRALDQYGNPMTGVAFTYSIANTSVATVSSSGVITPVSTGTTTVTASSNGKSATAQVSVVPKINVSLSGPNTVWSEGSHGWDVTASGGTGSYTYQWYVDYAYGSYTEDAGTGASAGLYVSGGTGPFAIRVIVTSGGASTEAGTFVCNFIEGANC